MSPANELRVGNCVHYRGQLEYIDSIGVILDEEPINGEPTYSLKMSPGAPDKPIRAYRDQVSSIVLNDKILSEFGFQFEKDANPRIYQFKQIMIVKVAIIPQGATVTGLGTYIENGVEVFNFGHFRVFEGEYDFKSLEFLERSLPVITANQLQNYSLDKYGEDIFGDNIDRILGTPLRRLRSDHL